MHFKSRVLGGVKPHSDIGLKKGGDWKQRVQKALFWLRGGPSGHIPHPPPHSLKFHIFTISPWGKKRRKWNVLRHSFPLKGGARANEGMTWAVNFELNTYKWTRLAQKKSRNVERFKFMVFLGSFSDPFLYKNTTLKTCGKKQTAHNCRIRKFPIQIARRKQSGSFLLIPV